MLYSQLTLDLVENEYMSYRTRRETHQKSLLSYTLAELRAEAKLWEVPRYSRKSKTELVYDLATKFSDHETCE